MSAAIVNYKASVKDGNDHPEDFLVAVPVSKIELNMLAIMMRGRDAINPGSAIFHTVTRILSHGSKVILDSRAWTCSCGNKATCLFRCANEAFGDNGRLTIAESPIPICDECRKTIGERVVDCFQCRKKGMDDEMYKCSRCKTATYCSYTCQKIHWTTGSHKKACVPKTS